jgi:type IV pilus assembly protein PilM
MLKPNRFLCLDLGASSVKLAEFQASKNGALTMTRFNFAEISMDPARQEHRSEITSEIIRDLLKEAGVNRAPALISVPGQSVFTRFVKLPAVEETKVVQIIQYEAQQNVPFPMEEVVWDYQLIGGGADKELEVILVAIKSEIIEEMTTVVTEANLPLQVVDVAPMALYNVARYSYPEWFAADSSSKECVMILDIGARTSNLIFVEENKVFSRSIPIAGNVITQAIAEEFKISFEEAEQLKRNRGMVGLGGAYEEPGDETQARLAKTIRNVITQLHADVNRSINFYRTQREGSPPTRLLLSGGSSILRYLDRFFQETLRLPVEYFNAFRNIQLGPQVSREELSQCAHFFGEVVGVALRRATECPIEVSLLPPKLQKTRAVQQKVPYFAGIGACVLLTLFCWYLYYSRVTSEVRLASGPLEARVQNLRKNQVIIDDLNRKVEEEEGRLTRLAELVEMRTAWARLLSELNTAIASDATMWVTSLKPGSGAVAAAAVPGHGNVFRPATAATGFSEITSL